MIMAHCEFCTSQHQAEFWRGHYFYAIDASSNDFPGFIRIVAVDHVAEMSALSPAVRTYLWPKESGSDAPETRNGARSNI